MSADQAVLLPPDDPDDELAADLPLLAAPADGVPDIVDTEHGLVELCAALAAGSGPVGLDTERASGFRYGQSAYLVQVRREDVGTFLIDPVALPDLSLLDDVLADTEWILHAATQDIPSLAELGLRPRRLFDTELGARLAGLPRAGLAPVVEHYLGLRLAKEHAAVDWSTRPLPEAWLNYAALDVEVLADLRNALAADLEAQGKAEWAAQEFEMLTRFEGPARRQDRWRRTSGLHRVRSPRGLAVVRSLWTEREELARQRDISPGRVLPDQVLVELAMGAPTTMAELGDRMSGGPRRPHMGLHRHARTWLRAIAHAASLPDDELPPTGTTSEGPPPARAWRDRDPVAAARLAAARASYEQLAADVKVPVENLLTPETLRRVLWSPPTPSSESAVAERLAELGARPWQVGLAVPIIVAALAIDSPDISEG